MNQPLLPLLLHRLVHRRVLLLVVRHDKVHVPNFRQVQLLGPPVEFLRLGVLQVLQQLVRRLQRVIPLVEDHMQQALQSDRQLVERDPLEASHILPGLDGFLHLRL